MHAPNALSLEFRKFHTSSFSPSVQSRVSVPKSKFAVMSKACIPCISGEFHSLLGNAESKNLSAALIDLWSQLNINDILRILDNGQNINLLFQFLTANLLFRSCEQFYDHVEKLHRRRLTANQLQPQFNSVMIHPSIITYYIILNNECSHLSPRSHRSDDRSSNEVRRWAYLHVLRTAILTRFSDPLTLSFSPTRSYAISARTKREFSRKLRIKKSDI